MLLRVALLMLGVAAAASVADKVEEAPKPTETFSKLEALVSKMAEGQSAPQPTAVTAEDVVILENAENRRRLANCNCAFYLDGTTAATAACYKTEGQGNVCRSACPSDYTPCTMSSTPAPSPTPG